MNAGVIDAVGVIDAEAADMLFHALADSTRREIVALAMTGDHSVSALARHFPMSFAAVQKHVSVLERAALVTKERRGREQLVRTNIGGVRSAAHLLDQYESMWRSRLGRFEALLAHRTEGEPT